MQIFSKKITEEMLKPVIPELVNCRLDNYIK